VPGVLLGALSASPPVTLVTSLQEKALNAQNRYTYPQPRPVSGGYVPWSKFNEHAWSKFIAQQQ
jgi:hypothetical protein